MAFRRRAATKTTEAHIAKALAMGALLRPLVSHLPPLRALRTALTQPSTAYADLQHAVAQTRDKLGIGQRAVLDYAILISEFAANDAFLVPVLWGAKQHHVAHPAAGAARDLCVPESRHPHRRLQVLDGARTGPCLHALHGRHRCRRRLCRCVRRCAAVPAGCGRRGLPRSLAAGRKAGGIKALQRHADQHLISLYTVYCQAQAHARAEGLAPSPVDEKADIHAVRNHRRGALVSALLFDPLPPEPAAYIAAAGNTFRSEFFPSLRHMLHARRTGPSYVQQLLNISLPDADALRQALIRG